MDDQGSGRHRLLIWLPLPVLITGLLISWLAANLAYQRAENIAIEVLSSRHQDMAELIMERVSGLLESGQLVVETVTQAAPEGAWPVPALIARKPGIVAADFRAELPSGTPSRNRDVVTTTTLSDTAVDGRRITLSELFIPADNGYWLALTLHPALWLADIFNDDGTQPFAQHLHDLNQHSKAPLIEHPTQGDLLPAMALRSEFAFGSRQWLLTTTPTHQFFAQYTRPFLQSVWLVGVLLSVLAAMITRSLTRRLTAVHRHRIEAERANNRLSQQIDNAQVEKNILKQALGNSELRSRDLVELTGGLVCELDEQLTIIYISPQSADLLGKPPAELAEQPFTWWIDESDRSNFNAAVAAARQEKTLERIDLHLLDRQHQRVSATVRIKAVVDPLSGCTGYRMTAQRSFS
ncbi:PAS domain-containing protein [Marinobacter caseinilyticus]|uniref:PAS domain-containing protein n=1 Tax=Marinobacter caseinilyticus TaxID=2692195 RepID=UPI001407DE87|nr:PAS domain-containing protein [Marinobacter caseinilyticus]